MIGLKRNERTFYYALFDSMTSAYDDYGNETGTPVITYKTPVEMKANISAAKGEAYAERFGTEVEYDRVILTCDMTCPIDEQTVLFVETEPTFDDDGNPLYDYVVRRVARSLNVISIAVSKVK